MNSLPTTRDRLVEAGIRLFSDHGYRGAAVRDLCNLARVNPGAVSYHFGGKRQLYRAVLRTAVERLAGIAAAAAIDDEGVLILRRGLTALERAIRSDPTLPRLLIRDVADGGVMAAEALAPVIRDLQLTVAGDLGVADDPARRREVTAALLRMAAPLLTAATAWPIFERTLGADEEDLRRLFDDISGGG